MGLFSDSVGKVLDVIGAGARLYAVRDSTATAATDAKWNPLVVGPMGDLRAGLVFTASEVPTEHDTNAIAANRGFIILTDGDLVFQLRDDAQDRTIPVTAGERFEGLDIKFLKTASTATILVLR